MGHPSPVTIQVPRQAIDNQFAGSVTSIIFGFIPALLQRNRNRVQIEVLGYDTDPRELFDIPEIRSWFQKLTKEIPEFFYWIDVTSYMFIFMALMLSQPVREERFSKKLVGVDPKDMQIYLHNGFLGLNNFCDKHGLSPEPTTHLINDVLRKLQ